MWCRAVWLDSWGAGGGFRAKLTPSREARAVIRFAVSALGTLRRLRFCRLGGRRKNFRYGSSRPRLSRSGGLTPVGRQGVLRISRHSGGFCDESLGDS